MAIEDFPLKNVSRLDNIQLLAYKNLLDETIEEIIAMGKVLGSKRREIINELNLRLVKLEIELAHAEKDRMQSDDIRYSTLLDLN